MNFFKLSSLTALFAGLSLSLASCGPDKNVEALTAQTSQLNDKLAQMAEASPECLKSAAAAYADNAIDISVVLGDSLINIEAVDAPLFKFFTAVEVKDNLTKDLETIVNAMAAKECKMNVAITDTEGKTKEFSLTAADFRNMVNKPLSQLGYSEARTNLFDMLNAECDQFNPGGVPVSSITSSFTKSGYYDYTVTFTDPRGFAGLTLPNLKARALKTFGYMFRNLGDLRMQVLKTMDELGVEGFHLIYASDKDDKTLKCTIMLSGLY